MGAVPSHVLLPAANEVTEGPYDLRALRCGQKGKNYLAAALLYGVRCAEPTLGDSKARLLMCSEQGQNNAQGATADWLGAAVGHLAAGLHVTGRALLGQIDA